VNASEIYIANTFHSHNTQRSLHEGAFSAAERNSSAIIAGIIRFKVRLLLKIALNKSLYSLYSCRRVHFKVMTHFRNDNLDQRD
jgi:hypothetical protein